MSSDAGDLWHFVNRRRVYFHRLAGDDSFKRRVGRIFIGVVLTVGSHNHPDPLYCMDDVILLS